MYEFPNSGVNESGQITDLKETCVQRWLSFQLKSLNLPYVERLEQQGNWRYRRVVLARLHMVDIAAHLQATAQTLMKITIITVKGGKILGRNQHSNILFNQIPPSSTCRASATSPPRDILIYLDNSKFC